MTRFTDGPAQGLVLMLRRAARFLRVVHDGKKFDALDQLNDRPRPEERIGTQFDNIHDAMNKGRARQGDYRKIIMPEDLKLIRKLHARQVPQTIIATMFGVSKALVCKLLRRGAYD